MKILADASLPCLDSAFPSPFQLTRYHNEDELFNLLNKQDVLLCRSTLKVNRTLLKDAHVNYVATASSGTDHLDHYYLKSRDIQIIDAKGCNAISVADYVVSCLAYLEQNHLIHGKNAGIIGMGHVGSKVYSRLSEAGFNLMTYDPLKAEQEREFNSCELEQLHQCDLLCIHAQLHNTHPYPSINLINKEFLSQLKPGCIIINAARGGIINEEALLNTSKLLIYCTDVYLNEPAINGRIVDKATLCTPHIAGHSLEAKYAAVSQVSEQLHFIVGLPPPQFAIPFFNKITHEHIGKSWQERVLSVYNPVHETIGLKQAKDKESAFINLRKRHNIRHDFSLYFDSYKQDNLIAT